jgi:hypothetical protein
VTEAYRGWAHCGLGSTVTTEDIRFMAPGVRMISTASLTLSALDADKVTIDMVVRNRIEGGTPTMPPTEVIQEIEIPAAAPPFDPASCGEPASHAEGPTLEDATETEGEEILQVAGQDIPCRWTLQRFTSGPCRVSLKTWYSDLIPGGIARFEGRGDGMPEQDSTTTVVSFLKK